MTDQDPGAARLKDDIDSGRTGDKTAGYDPAAAPLGTDDEASRVAPPSAASAPAERAGVKPDRHRNAAQPELAPDARMERKPWVVTGFAFGAAAGLVFGAVLWAVLR